MSERMNERDIDRMEEKFRELSAEIEVARKTEKSRMFDRIKSMADEADRIRTRESWEADKLRITKEREEARLKEQLDKSNRFFTLYGGTYSGRFSCKFPNWSASPKHINCDCVDSVMYCFCGAIYSRDTYDCCPKCGMIIKADHGANCECRKCDSVRAIREENGHGSDCICNSCNAPTTPSHYGQHSNCWRCKSFSKVEKYQGKLYQDKNDKRIGVWCHLWNCRDRQWVCGYPQKVFRQLVDGRMKIVGFVDNNSQRWDKAEQVKH